MRQRETDRTARASWPGWSRIFLEEGAAAATYGRSCDLTRFPGYPRIGPRGRTGVMRIIDIFHSAMIKTDHSTERLGKWADSRGKS